MSSIETVMRYTVNQLLFTMDLFRNLLPINCFAKTNVCDQGISKLIGYNNHITTIGLLREYMRRRGPQESCGNISHTNNSWFTVSENFSH